MLYLCQLCQLIFDLLCQVFGSFRVMVCLQCIKQTLLVWVEWTSRNFVPHGEEKTGNYLIGRSGMRRRSTWILHLHISHNAPFLPPPLPPPPQKKKLWISIVFNFSSTTVMPRRIQNKGYAKFWVANKVYHGRCANGEFPDFCGRTKRPLVIWERD